MILAALVSLSLTIFLGPRFINLLYNLKTGQSIRVSDCPMLAKLHEKKKHTPTMGGILILFSMLVSLVLFMDFSSAFTLILLMGTLWLGAIGGADDYLKMKHKNSRGLPGRLKMLFQLLFALLLSLYLLVPAVSKAMKRLLFFTLLLQKNPNQKVLLKEKSDA